MNSFLPMPINDLVFRELTKSGVSQDRVWNLTSSELWYVTEEQAQRYIDLEHSAAYGLVQVETGLIEKHIDEIVKCLSDSRYNLVDLGCGDGQKAALFIGKLRQRVSVRYCPVDISDYMVSKALETMRTLSIDSVVECKDNVSDFGNLANVMPAFRRNGYGTSLILLLGNTVGNFEGEDILAGIQDSMLPQDYLLIGTELCGQQRPEEIVARYKSNHVTACSYNLLRTIGLDDSDTSFEVEFNEHRVQLYHILVHDKTVSHLGRQAEFRAGDRIDTVFSYKYREQELQGVLERRFNTVQIFSNSSYALVLCKK